MANSITWRIVSGRSKEELTSDIKTLEDMKKMMEKKDMINDESKLIYDLIKQLISAKKERRLHYS